MKKQLPTYKSGKFEFHLGPPATGQGNVPPFEEVLNKYRAAQTGAGGAVPWYAGKVFLAGMAVLFLAGISTAVLSGWFKGPATKGRNSLIINSPDKTNNIGRDSGSMASSPLLPKINKAPVQARNEYSQSNIDGESGSGNAAMYPAADLVDGIAVDQKNNYQVQEVQPDEEVLDLAYSIPKPKRILKSWKAPVEAWDLKFHEIVIDADKPSTITFDGGSTISIPANAFTDKNGNLLHGKVHIWLRSIRDAVDMMVTGVPMQYPAAGPDAYLESAGMFEIRGYQNEEAILIADGKELSVKQVSAAGDGYGTYYLDDSTGSWTFMGDEVLANKMVYSSTKMTPWQSIKNFFRTGIVATVDERKEPNLAGDSVYGTALAHYSVIREFQINKFGCWNSDRPFVRDAHRLSAVFTDEKNEYKTVVYQIEKNSNTLMSNYMQQMNTKISFDLKKENIWFLIDPVSKKILFASAAQFKSQIESQMPNHGGKKLLRVNMQWSERSFISVDEIRIFLLGNTDKKTVKDIPRKR